MLPIAIQFQAYIPNSLGRPLISYFENQSAFELLSNKEAFVRKLRAKDFGNVTWLPEPGNFATNYYFATDDVDFHSHHSEHSIRLGVHAVIELEKIGNYSLTDRIFKHEHHKGWGGVNSQHSGESHRVYACIKRIPFYDDMPRASNRDFYVGICDEVASTMRSEEAPLETSISNSKKDSFLRRGNDVTTIKFSAEASYPFLKSASAPDISFELNITLYKNLSSKSIDVNIDGWHNNFPAYELIIDHRVVYKYDPSDFGHTGPDYFNLSLTRDFSATKWIRLSDWQVKELSREKKYGW